MKKGILAILTVLTVFALMMMTGCPTPASTKLTLYTVTFDLNGGGGKAPNAQKQASVGAEITLPGKGSMTAPTGKPNFIGWSEKEDGTDPLTGQYTPEKNITLYAVWTAAATFNVTYDLNGGTGTAPTQAPVTSGTAINLAAGTGLTGPTATPNFAGWSLTQGGAAITGTTTTITANTTLYAVWTAATTYTVTYNITGSTAGTAPTQAPVTSGTVITLAAGTGLTGPTATPTFAGWSLTQGGAVITGTTTTITANTTLYAVWTAEAAKYTVSFDANGGSGTQAAITQSAAGAAITLPATTTFTAPSGKTFDGWSETATGAKLSGTTYTPTTNKTLYAVWAQNAATTFTVTFDKNGGDTEADPTTKEGGASGVGTLPTPPTKAGYVFDGWWDKTGNNFIEYLSSTPVSANVTVTAKWVSAYTADGNYEVPLTGVKVKNTDKLQAAGDSGMWIPLTFPADFDIGAYDAFTIVLRAYNDSGARITSGISWGWIRFGFTKSMSSTGSVVITTPDLAAGKGSLYYNYSMNGIGTNQTLAADGGDPVNYIPAAVAFLVDTNGFDIKYMALESLTFRRRTAAAAPSITTQPLSQVFEAGDEINTLSVVANVIDNGDLTYQWYSATAIVGGTTELIEDATDATYDPPIDSSSATGDFFYYVVVTNTNNKALTTKTASTPSVRVKITDTVPPPAITVDFTGKTITSLGGGASGVVLSDNTGFTYTNTANGGHGLKFTVDIGSAKLSDYDNITFTMAAVGTGDTNWKDIYLRGAATLTGTSTTDDLISTEKSVQYANPSKEMKYNIDKAATNALTGTIEIGIVLSYSTAASWTISNFTLNP